MVKYINQYKYEGKCDYSHKYVDIDSQRLINNDWLMDMLLITIFYLYIY